MANSGSGKPEDSDYGAEHIKVLRGLEAVKKRPGMYVGDPATQEGLHRMPSYLIEDAMDERRAGFGGRLWVTLRADGSCMVADDGRGLSRRILPDSQADSLKSYAETAVTTLYAGGWWRVQSPTGMQRRPRSTCVVNALSSAFRLVTMCEGEQSLLRFSDGDLLAPPKRLGGASGEGLEITFRPNPALFRGAGRFSADRIERHLREQVCLSGGGEAWLIDQRRSQPREIYFDGQIGIAALLVVEPDDHQALTDAPLRAKAAGGEPGAEITVEAALRWLEDDDVNIRCYCNAIYQSEGGAHKLGLEHALTCAFSDPQGLDDESYFSGLRAVVSVWMEQSAFTRSRQELQSKAVYDLVIEATSAALEKWRRERPDEFRLIAGRG